MPNDVPDELADYVARVHGWSWGRQIDFFCAIPRDERENYLALALQKKHQASEAPQPEGGE